MKKKLLVVLSLFFVFILLLKGESVLTMVKSKITNTSRQTVAQAIEKIDSSKKDMVDKLIAKDDGSTYDSLTIISLKDEKSVEIWGVDNSTKKKLISYNITAASGVMGPKLREGDRQVPEGIYSLEYLNPNSSYHLSMKINYPNAFDKSMAKDEGRTNLGGDIFIHGKAASIGCVAIGDSAIEELFYMVNKIGMSKVKVIVAPYDLRTQSKERTSGVDIPWYPKLVESISSEINLYK